MCFEFQVPNRELAKEEVLGTQSESNVLKEEKLFSYKWKVESKEIKKDSCSIQCAHTVFGIKF